MRGKERKERRPLTTDQKVEIALARFGPRGKLTEIQELAGRYDRDPAVISRAISEAFAKGLVEVRRAELGPERVLELEERLVEKYGLQVARVVREPESSEDDFGRNDAVHAATGWAMAELIANGAIFRPNESIALGSGRGVYSTVLALSQMPPLHVPHVTLLSLTGDVYARHHSRPHNITLDSDNHVQIMAQCFAHEVTLRLLSCYISYEDADTIDRVRSRTWLSEERWPKPTHALIGVGILGPGHRFYDAVSGSRTTAEKRFADTEPPLRLREALKVLIDKAGAAAPHLVIGDIGNSLFVTPENSDTAREEIQPLIDRINGLLINARPDQLKAVPNIMLVAGTKQKARAVRQLLDGGHYNIRFLSTSEGCAKAMLAGG